MIARAFASSSKPRIARGIHLFIGLLVLLFLPIQICKLAICRPIRTFWEDQSSHSHKQNDGADNSNNIMGRCLNQGILFLCDSIVAVLSDLAILLLPIYLTWSLAVAVEKKLKISVLLGAGGIAVGLTAYRLYKSWQYAQTTNLTVDYVPIAILSYVGFSFFRFPNPVTLRREVAVLAVVVVVVVFYLMGDTVVIPIALQTEQG